MTRRRRRGMARMLFGSSAVAVVLALAAPAEATAHGDEAHAAAPAATAPVGAIAVSLASGARCASQLSCGYGCAAKLMLGYCAVLLEWEGQVGIGRLKLFPSLRIECHVCECWYIMPGPNGSIFKRTVDFGCGGGFDGLVVH